ncbi:hypothetical protein, partial [Flavobacterium aestuarii]|uniref:hypothetical protein n=1 Tax=Flavobacterium aestuarii TaxID=3149227 RepID=UPI0032B498D2
HFGCIYAAEQRVFTNIMICLTFCPLYFIINSRRVSSWISSLGMVASFSAGCPFSAVAYHFLCV